MKRLNWKLSMTTYECLQQTVLSLEDKQKLVAAWVKKSCCGKLCHTLNKSGWLRDAGVEEELSFQVYWFKIANKSYS